MYVKRNYSFWMTFNWSKKAFILGSLYAAVICSLSYFFQITISIPWQPISVIGIAVAFYLGFKNNSSYDRTWEARKIWGGIVNTSRSFGASVIAYVNGPEKEKIASEIIHRHLAWITALRHQLRLSREWEHIEDRLNSLYTPTVCENYVKKLDEELLCYLPAEEIETYKNKSNIATQILKTQTKRLQELRDMDYFEDFRHMEFHQLIVSMYADQGKSERIKSFPFPRQYASTALWLSFVFCGLLPLGMIDFFTKLDGWLFWLCPFISGLIIWIFFLMEKIGDYSENPFEGTYNDVPITSISRTIEIDLREMLDEKNIPKPIAAEDGFLM